MIHSVLVAEPAIVSGVWNMLEAEWVGFYAPYHDPVVRFNDVDCMGVYWAASRSPGKFSSVTS
jgi:hypothetical protein